MYQMIKICKQDSIQKAWQLAFSRIGRAAYPNPLIPFSHSSMFQSRLLLYLRHRTLTPVATRAYSDGSGIT